MIGDYMKYLIIVISTLMFCASATAKTYFLYPTKGLRTPQSIRQTFHELLSSALSENESDVTESRSTANYLIKSKIIQLGDSYVISVKKYSAKKKKLFYTKIKANSVNELDKVADRLALSLIKEVKANKSIQVGSITKEDETRVSQRTQSLSLQSFGIGPAVYTNMDDTGTATLINLGYLWEVTPTAAIKLSTDIVTKLKTPWTSLGSVTIGGQYFFSKSNISPSVGVDFGYGGTVTGVKDLKNTSGFTVGANAGLNFFRTADKQMSLQLRYLIILEKNQIGAPSILGLLLSIHY